MGLFSLLKKDDKLSPKTELKNENIEVSLNQSSFSKKEIVIPPNNSKKSTKKNTLSKNSKKSENDDATLMKKALEYEEITSENQLTDCENFYGGIGFKPKYLPHDDPQILTRVGTVYNGYPAFLAGIEEDDILNISVNEIRNGGPIGEPIKFKVIRKSGEVRDLILIRTKICNL